ncbi:MAG TPA: glycosyltransferase [Clostridiales bacterium]|nr:glycosyltransferase [Clostridiales bacterium]
MKLTIGMIVKNESRHLKKCLEALQPVLDGVDSELIIVDTGSTDNTVEIARQFTDKVYFHEWEDDFARARNVTIDKARGQWYFYIDADEVLEKAEDIIEFFNTDKHNRFNALAVKIKNIHIEDNDQAVSEFYSLRIIRLDGQTRFKGRIHEQIPVKGPVLLSKACLNHRGYLNTDQQLMERKFQRNSELLKKALEDMPDDYNILYHLAKIYRMHEDYSQAGGYIERAYNIVRSKKIHPMYIYNGLIRHYIHQGRFSDAERVCLEAVKNKKADTTAYIDTYYYLASARASQGKYEKAVDSYNRYLKLLDAYNKNELPMDFSTQVYTAKVQDHVHLQLSSLYDKLGNEDKAVAQANIVLDLQKKDKDWKAALKQLVHLWVKYGRYDQITSYYEEILDMPSHWDDDRETLFTYLLEREMGKRLAARKELISRFAGLQRDTGYALLNRVRMWLDNTGHQKDTDELVSKIYFLDMGNRQNFYGDILYFLMRLNKPLTKVLKGVREHKLEGFVKYIHSRHKDADEVIIDYICSRGTNLSLEETRICKILALLVLLKDSIAMDRYRDILKRYLDFGTSYLEKLYSPEVINEQNAALVKTDEDAFLLYAYHAQRVMDENPAEYVRYLRKALKEYPYMKKAVEVLVQDIQDRQSAAQKEPYGQFEEYKKTVKSNINMLIEAQKFEEAKMLIDEYLKILPDDGDIYSSKGIIAMMEGDLALAEEIFLEGLSVDENNFDLNFNLAYLYRSQQDNQKAAVYYKKALENAEDEQSKKELKELLGLVEDTDKTIVEKTANKDFKSRKLHLGCGRNILKGWINLDIIHLPGVDVVADLDNCKNVRLPFDDNSIEEFYASHLIEHINNPLPMMEELHRIAKPNAIAVFKCPYGSSDDAVEDPTHVRQYFLTSFGYFSQPFYWRADYGYRGDWLTEKITLVVDKDRYSGKTPQEILEEVNRYRNVVKEMIVQLKAIKPIREPKKELQTLPKIEICLM